MPRHSSAQFDVQGLVQDFVQQLAATIEAATQQRIRSVLSGIMGGFSVRRGPGRPPKNGTAAVTSAKPRKKLPKQFCPVPGCKNVAAPIFGMTCAQHKDVPKAKIKKYREARRAAKEKKAA